MLPAAPKIHLAKLSAFAAILFMAGFLLVNVFTFSEGTRRIEVIDDLNHLDIPRIITDIDELLWQTDAIIDHQPQEGEEDDFNHHIFELHETFAQLQINAEPIADGNELKPHFNEIFTSLEHVRLLYQHIYSSDRDRQETFMPIMDNINFHFNRLALWALDRHHSLVTNSLEKLRQRDQFLRWANIAFVTLGTLAIIFLVLDLLRRDELMMNARQAERMKSSFFAMMSHEIRTPINGVLGMLTLLMESVLSKEQSQMAKIAKGSAEGLLNIVNDVLDYSKIEAGKLELEYADFSLRDLINDVIELMAPMARNKNLSISHNVASDLPDAIRADPVRVRQILFNFLSNAVKFTESGSVQVQVLRDYNMRDAAIRFNVIDSGIGISNEERALLFREFSQVEGALSRRFNGTGLGLAISSRLAAMMKGTIGVISEKGKGSTFWFSIPLQEAQMALKAAQPDIPTENMRKVDILVVEDNATNQIIAATFLRNAGHRVDVAENGAQAVAAVKLKSYDLIFMDVSMPVMDGLEATKTIRALGGCHKHIPILAMTAHAMRGDREECLKAGMNGYLTKPATRDTLLQSVQRWTGSPQDATLLCSENLNSPNHNPDGSLVQPAFQPPCAENTVFPFESQEIREEAFSQLYNDLGKDGFIKYGKVFQADISKVSRELTTAATKEDWAAVQLHAHSIKSSVLNFGLMKLSSLAEKIELQCEQNGKAEPDLIQQMPNAWSCAISSLNARFTSLGLPPL